MPKIAIIGYGRFGKTLYRLLGADFTCQIYEPNQEALADIALLPGDKLVADYSEIYQSDEPISIFFCVPIVNFNQVIAQHRQYFKANHLLIDVLSVKKYPKAVFTTALKGTKAQALLTHPMFGPDSSRGGFKDLPIVLDKFKASNENYQFWKKYFQTKGLKVHELTAQEHDQFAANSQAITHFLGRVLAEFKLKPTPTDTLGAKKLQEIVEQTCHDSWELFTNLQNYNPYTHKALLKFEAALDTVYNKILDAAPPKAKPIFGIQGGVGSFNEQALTDYVKRQQIKDYQVKYLYTTQRVLAELHEGNIDFNLFAMHNSIGGVVGESIQAIANYKFTIVEEFAIAIRHFMLKRPEQALKQIDTIMTHPQVALQCQTTLKTKYPQYKIIAGQGDLIDSANAAKALAKGKLQANIAVMGPEILSQIYQLEIIASDLQDAKNNLTSFLMVKR